MKSRRRVRDIHGNVDCADALMAIFGLAQDPTWLEMKRALRKRAKASSTVDKCKRNGARRLAGSDQGSIYAHGEHGAGIRPATSRAPRSVRKKDTVVSEKGTEPQ
jgi:hypothetical protein